MFSSFFPKPKLFFVSAVVWAALGMAAWYLFARDLGPSLSIGDLFGYGYPVALPEGADDAAKAAFTAQSGFAADLWTYQYMILCSALFCVFWACAVAAPLVLVVGGRLGGDHLRHLVPGPGRRDDQRLVRPLLRHGPGRRWAKPGRWRPPPSTARSEPSPASPRSRCSSAFSPASWSAIISSAGARR